MRLLPIFAFFYLTIFALSNLLIFQWSLRNIRWLYLLLVKFHIVVTNFRQQIPFSIFCWFYAMIISIFVIFLKLFIYDTFSWLLIIIFIILLIYLLTLYGAHFSFLLWVIIPFSILFSSSYFCFLFFFFIYFSYCCIAIIINFFCIF